MKDKYTRVFGLLVISQAACLALGIWLENRFVQSLEENFAEGGTKVVVSESFSTDEQDQELTSELSLEAQSEISTTAMRAIVFFWIAAIQAFVAYIILSPLRTETSLKQIQAAKESLRRHNDLIRTRDAVIFGLAKLADSRDPETGNHLERISIYSTRLATALRRHPNYSDIITSSFIKLIGISSALHDIGKVGINDSILQKPGSLDSDEQLSMQSHAGIGGQCIREIEMRLGSSNFLQMARDIAFCHHERWDGTGYPKGIAGEEIPLSARIVAVADVYDALSTKRVYKKAFPHEKCVQLIKEESGSQFDPIIVEVFLGIESEFEAIARKCSLAVEPAEDETLLAEEKLELAPDNSLIQTVVGTSEFEGTVLDETFIANINS